MKDPDGLLVSYLALRRAIGTIGVALPLVLLVWGVVIRGEWEPLPSMSDYYSLRTRDAFVGSLIAIAPFMFTYKGYERIDNIAAYMAGVFAVGVALFPNSGGSVERKVHFSSAIALFGTLAFFSFFLFTKSKPHKTKAKVKRNVVYRVCGVVMIACIVAIGAFYLFLQHTRVAAWEPVFWLEWAALWAFGVSWFVKGEAILGDK